MTFDRKAYDKAYKEANKEKIKEQNKAYREANKEKRKAYLKAWREANKEKIKAWREANKEKKNAYDKAYRQANKEKLKAYREVYNEANKDKVNASTAKRRSAKINRTPPWLTEEDLAKIREFYKEAQIKTEETGEKWHVDHIIPLQGENVSGLHIPSNLQVVPARWNIAKGNRWEEK